MQVEAGALVRQTAERFGDRTALTAQARSLSFTDLNSAANRVGSALLELGARRGDRVGVLAYNTPEVVEAWLGFEKHNLVRAVLHSHFPMDAHVASLNHIQASTLIFDTRFTEQLDAVRGDLTSVRHLVAVGADDVNLHFHPIQWASGFQTLYPYFLRGARSVLLDDEAFDPDLLLDTITAEAVTGVFMPGPLLTPVLDAVERRGGLEHRLRRMVVFFGTAELLERTTQLLGPVWAHGFGSTEQGAITTRLLPSEVGERRERLQSVGRPGAPFFEVAIFDDNGKRLDPGQIGEIAVRSAMSIGEYWALPDKTREAFFPGDWFRPYDVGYLDEDGFLYYADRAGDKITAAGGVVFPHLVETAVLRHDAVANCGVVGLGEPGEQQVVAAVILKADRNGSTELVEEILAGTADLARHEQPSRVVFVDELPTVLGGAKVQRQALREQLAAQP